MLVFTTTILQFKKQGEKTGWTYIEIPLEVTEKLNPSIKKSFRVKGKLDNYSFKQLALLPIKNGDFIMSLNATTRKKIGKNKDASINVQIELDFEPLLINQEFIECLEYDNLALAFFDTLSKSHQMYFSKWIESAKTENTKANRITKSIIALANNLEFPEMLRASKKDS
jgi:Domain of unknown function (DUF1905)/Bacteriocin-protection, YdeI or OmpD-Associated